MTQGMDFNDILKQQELTHQQNSIRQEKRRLD